MAILRPKVLWGLLCIPLVFALLAARNEKAQGTKWALVVGVDNYDDSSSLQPLHAAGADAESIGRSLVETCGFPKEHVMVLDSASGEKPTATNILYELQNLAKNSKPDDMVVFYYAGHGTEIDAQSYLLPSNADLRTEFTLKRSAVPTSDILDLLSTMPANTIVQIYDMCRCAPFVSTRDASNARAITPGQVRALTPASKEGKQIVTLFSCSPDQSSYENLKQNRGYYSLYLQKGLEGAALDADGSVSIGSLQGYLRTAVQKAVQQDMNVEQQPYMDAQGQDPNLIKLVLPQVKDSGGTLEVTPYLAGEAELQIKFSDNLEHHLVLQPDPEWQKATELDVNGRKVAAHTGSEVFHYSGSDTSRGPIKVDLMILSDGFQRFTTSLTLRPGTATVFTPRLTPNDDHYMLADENNLKQVLLALLMYANDWDDRLPVAHSFSELKGPLTPYVKTEEAFRPEKGEYAFNSGACGIDLGQLPDPVRTPFVYNAMASPDGRRVVVFADGHCKIVDASSWTASQPFLRLHAAPVGATTFAPGELAPARSLQPSGFVDHFGGYSNSGDALGTLLLKSDVIPYAQDAASFLEALIEAGALDEVYFGCPSLEIKMKGGNVLHVLWNASLGGVDTSSCHLDPKTPVLYDDRAHPQYDDPSHPKRQALLWSGDVVKVSEEDWKKTYEPLTHLNLPRVGKPLPLSLGDEYRKKVQAHQNSGG